MKTLIECVPNFSEGRRADVIAAIVNAMRAVPEARVLDAESDADHNRSVVTLVGPPGAVQEAAFQGIKTAAALIDLDVHRGEHPRLGATDVVPFIPISGVTMADCVALARDLGRRVGEELGIPVYLYEQAALRPERVNLEDVRRGEYEALKAEIGKNPARDPDFGPKAVGKAGATIIGARPFLVAFNAYLNTDNVSIAQKIARALRHSNGGYRYVKAMGLLVAGQAQVSMNLTNFPQTPIHRVVETIRSEAARYGVVVTHTELVGLIPQQALIDAAQWYLQLDLFEPDQILENKLAALDEGAPVGFLDAVAANTPAPGGGAVAALAGALAAALVTMVGRLTVGKRHYADVQEEATEAVTRAEKLRATLTKAMDEDSAAFNAVMAAYKLPKATEEEQHARDAAIQEATVHATEVPLATARAALEALELALLVASKGNVNAASDAATAAWMAMASIQSAALNVRVNAANLQDTAQKDAWLAELDAIDTRAQTLLKDVQTVAAQRAGI
ncbi:MAG TPA: glutamate formimidoyltransferase [Anaerolineae bacterium]|nr:glutamate formimidoyltransferase [Anaerolineae bacterium]HQI86612.1 glutamate formimidoyltransferase [Anaerolineae bacterium]